MIRDQIKSALIVAMKAHDEKTVSTLRMAQSTIKNKDIELRTGSAPETGSAADDVLVIDVLTKMVKQRRESIEMFEKGNRQALADGEKAEIAVLEQFMPKMMSDADAAGAIKALVDELGVTSAKDMGKVMSALKERFAGQIDMGKAGGLVKVTIGG